MLTILAKMTNLVIDVSYIFSLKMIKMIKMIKVINSKSWIKKEILILDSYLNELSNEI